MIKHILDYVLSPEPVDSQAPSNQTDPFDIASMSWDSMPTFGVELENFFENIDWDAIPLEDNRH